MLNKAKSKNDIPYLLQPVTRITQLIKKSSQIKKANDTGDGGFQDEYDK